MASIVITLTDLPDSVGYSFVCSEDFDVDAEGTATLVSGEQSKALDFAQTILQAMVVVGGSIPELIRREDTE
jgi:hypothetical protein